MSCRRESHGITRISPATLNFNLPILYIFKIYHAVMLGYVTKSNIFWFSPILTWWTHALLHAWRFLRQEKVRPFPILDPR